MRLTGQKLKKLIKEAYQQNAFINALYQNFAVKDITDKHMPVGYHRDYKATKVFWPDCKVVLFFTQYSDGHIYISDLATLDRASSQVNPDCFRQGYARQVLQDFVGLADQFDIDMSLTAASIHKERVPNSALVKFYEEFGFGGGNPDSGWVEMIRDKKSDRLGSNL